jgi:methylmalonyl-CoA mutase, N-terminal domain
MMQEAIARSAYAQQRAIESGEMEVVGVNTYVEDPTLASEPAPDYSALAAQQITRLAALRQGREAGAVTRSLGELRLAAARPDAPLMPAMLDAVRARATVGEISDTLRQVWGEFRAA